MLMIVMQHHFLNTYNYWWEFSAAVLDDWFWFFHMFALILFCRDRIMTFILLHHCELAIISNCQLCFKRQQELALMKQ